MGAAQLADDDDDDEEEEASASAGDGGAAMDETEAARVPSEQAQTRCVSSGSSLDPWHCMLRMRMSGKVVCQLLRTRLLSSLLGSSYMGRLVWTHDTLWQQLLPVSVLSTNMCARHPHW